MRPACADTENRTFWLMMALLVVFTALGFGAGYARGWDKGQAARDRAWCEALRKNGIEIDLPTCQ